MTIKERLKDFQQRKIAILATNFYNFETLTAVLKAAKEVNAPVMLQLTKGSIDYMGLKQAVRMGRQGIADYALEGYIHLDHGPSIDLVKRCLDEGFDSVMLDYSEHSFNENVKATQTVVEMAQSYNANVEAELGFVAKLGQNQKGEFTNPEDVSRFVKATGVNALAIAFGSAHGFYKLPPHLDIPRLRKIHQTSDVILVLHGSSGIPENMVHEAIENGITKVNLATEIKDTFMRNLKSTLMKSDEIDLRKVFPLAVAPTVELLIKKYRMSGSALK